MKTILFITCAFFHSIANGICAPTESNICYKVIFNRDGIDTCVTLLIKYQTSIHDTINPLDADYISANRPHSFLEVEFFNASSRASFQAAINLDELLRILNIVSSHEIFNLPPVAMTKEPDALILDSYEIIMVRTMGQKQVTIKRQAGESVPVDRFVEALWSEVKAQYSKAPQAEQERFRQQVEDAGIVAP